MDEEAAIWVIIHNRDFSCIFKTSRSYAYPTAVGYIWKAAVASFVPIINLFVGMS